MKSFRRYQLRTTDVPAARAFYNTILGEGVADIEPLPRQAIERGAPAHWLGFIGVENVEHAVRSFIEQGAMQLGPTLPAPGGGQSAVCRDPGGAIVAFTSAPPQTTGQTMGATKPEVIWHQLFASNADRTASAYCELFGWQLGEQRHHHEHGAHQEFTWQPGKDSVGSVADVAARRGVHSHWLFHFHVPSLDHALAQVRAAGGVVVGPTSLDNGDRVAMCEDPQGAAFMLHECVHPRSTNRVSDTSNAPLDSPSAAAAPKSESSIQELARTALWVAAMRALETEREKPLFRDPYARRLAGAEFVEELRQHYQVNKAMPPAIEVRTRWLDDQIALALGRGIRQVVILAAGMDARAYRLAWPADTCLFELDHGDVLREKEEKLVDVQPKCERRTVSIDLDDDWPGALRKQGLRTDVPTLWLLEGLLVYLPETLVRRILGDINSISVKGSIVLMDIVGRSLLESSHSRQLHELANQFGTDEPEELLTSMGWTANVHSTAAVGKQLNRWPYEVHPRGTPGIPHSYLVHGLIN